MNEYEHLRSVVRAYAPQNDAHVLRRNIASVIDEVEMDRNVNGKRTIYELLIDWGEEGRMNNKGPTTWVIRVPHFKTEVESGQLSGFAGRDEGIAQIKKVLEKRGWAVDVWVGHGVMFGDDLARVYRTRVFDRD